MPATHGCSLGWASRGAEAGKVPKPLGLTSGRVGAKETSLGEGGGGRDESERHRAESQWIVAARPLCHLQYPVAYLSRLQRIQPAAR